MKKDPRDSLFKRRAIFLNPSCAEDANDQAVTDLDWLSRFFLIVLAGDSRSRRLDEASIGYVNLERHDIGSFLSARAVEPYASWYLGKGPSLGFRAVLPCGTPSAAGRSLREIRQRESHSRIIVDDQRLVELVKSLRRKHSKIVFTNGVFDLLHIGHLRLLEAAKALGDVLIVAINSDDSTKRIKGTTRPIVPQFARAEILATLREVDYCAIFTEDDPKRILSIVKPDVLAKGCEYSLNRVVGARYVTDYGGTVMRLPLVEGWSTTSTIRDIARRTVRLPRSSRR